MSNILNEIFDIDDHFMNDELTKDYDLSQLNQLTNYDIITEINPTNINEKDESNNQNYIYDKNMKHSSFSLPDKLNLLSLNLNNLTNYSTNNISSNLSSNSSKSPSPEFIQFKDFHDDRTINPQELMGKIDYYLPSSLSSSIQSSSSPNLTKLNNNSRNLSSQQNNLYQPNDIQNFYNSADNNTINNNILPQINDQINDRIINDQNTIIERKYESGNNVKKYHHKKHGSVSDIYNKDKIQNDLNSSIDDDKFQKKLNLEMNNECFNAIKIWINDSNEQNPTGIFRRNSINIIPTRRAKSNEENKLIPNNIGTINDSNYNMINNIGNNNNNSYGTNNGNYGGIDKRRRRKSYNSKNDNENDISTIRNLNNNIKNVNTQLDNNIKDINVDEFNEVEDNDKHKIKNNDSAIDDDFDYREEVVENIPVHHGRVVKNEPIIIPPQEDGKPFPCPNCSKQFKRSEHLKRHIRSVHSNIRPFHCKYCEKQFSRSDNLAQHLKTHYKVNENGTTLIIYGNPNLHHRGGRRKSSGTVSSMNYLKNQINDSLKNNNIHHNHINHSSDNSSSNTSTTTTTSPVNQIPITNIPKIPSVNGNSRTNSKSNRNSSNNLVVDNNINLDFDHLKFKNDLDFDNDLELDLPI